GHRDGRRRGRHRPDHPPAPHPVRDRGHGGRSVRGHDHRPVPAPAPGNCALTGYGSTMVSGTLMLNFTPCGSGIASRVAWWTSAILRTIARPRPEPGNARALADR